MKLEGKKLAVVFIATVLLFIAVSIWSIRDESKNDINYTSEIADCFGMPEQCGLHILIEEKEVEDQTLEFVKNLLEKNTLGLPKADRAKGIRIVNYLKLISIDERINIISEAFDKYIKSNTP